MREYIDKEKLLEVFEKLKAAREKKRNCSSRSAMEYDAFNYVITVINRMESVQIED